MAPYAGDHSEAHIRDLSAAEMMTCTGCGYPFLVVAHICDEDLTLTGLLRPGVYKSGFDCDALPKTRI
jgi:hypothetical protein